MNPSSELHAIMQKRLARCEQEKTRETSNEGGDGDYDEDDNEVSAITQQQSIARKRTPLRDEEPRSQLQQQQQPQPHTPRFNATTTTASTANLTAVKQNIARFNNQTPSPLTIDDKFKSPSTTTSTRSYSPANVSLTPVHRKFNAYVQNVNANANANVSTKFTPSPSPQSQSQLHSLREGVHVGDKKKELPYHEPLKSPSSLSRTGRGRKSPPTPAFSFVPVSKSAGGTSINANTRTSTSIGTPGPEFSARKTPSPTFFSATLPTPSSSHRANSSPTFTPKSMSTNASESKGTTQFSTTSNTTTSASPSKSKISSSSTSLSSSHVEAMKKKFLWKSNPSPSPPPPPHPQPMISPRATNLKSPPPPPPSHPPPPSSVKNSPLRKKRNVKKASENAAAAAPTPAPAPELSIEKETKGVGKTKMDNDNDDGDGSGDYGGDGDGDGDGDHVEDDPVFPSPFNNVNSADIPPPPQPGDFEMNAFPNWTSDVMITDNDAQEDDVHDHDHNHNHDRNNEAKWDWANDPFSNGISGGGGGGDMNMQMMQMDEKRTAMAEEEEKTQRVEDDEDFYPDEYIPPPSFGNDIIFAQNSLSTSVEAKDDEEKYDCDDSDVESITSTDAEPRTDDRIMLKSFRIDSNLESSYDRSLSCQNPLTRNMILCRRRKVGRKKIWSIDEIDISRTSTNRDGEGHSNTVASMDISISELQKAASSLDSMNGIIAYGIKNVVGIAAGEYHQGGNLNVRVVAIIHLNVLGANVPVEVFATWRWGCQNINGRSFSLHRVLVAPTSKYEPTSLCVANDVVFVSSSTEQATPIVYISRLHSRGSWIGNAMSFDNEPIKASRIIHMTASAKSQLLAVSLDNGSISIWTYKGIGSTTQSTNKAQASLSSQMQLICTLQGISSLDKLPPRLFLDVRGKDDEVASDMKEDDDDVDAKDSVCCHLSWMPNFSKDSSPTLILAASFRTGIAIYNITQPFGRSTPGRYATPSVSELSTNSDTYEKKRISSEIILVTPFAGGRVSRKRSTSSRVDWISCGPGRLPFVATIFLGEDLRIMMYVGSLDLPSYGNTPNVETTTLSTVSEEVSFHPIVAIRELDIYGSLYFGNMIAHNDGSLYGFYLSRSHSDGRNTNPLSYYHSIPVASNAFGLTSNGIPLHDQDDILHIHTTITCVRKNKDTTPSTMRGQWGVPSYRHWLCRSTAGDKSDKRSKEDNQNIDFPTSGSFTDVICDLTCSDAASAALVPTRIVRDWSGKNCIVLFVSTVNGDNSRSEIDTIAFTTLDTSGKQNVLNTFDLHRARDAAFIPNNGQYPASKILVLDHDGEWLGECNSMEVNEMLKKDECRTRIFTQGSSNDQRLNVRRLFVLQCGSIVFFACRKIDGRGCLFLGGNTSSLNFRSDKAYLRKKVDIFFLRKGEDLLSLTALPPMKGISNIAVATTNRVMIFSMGASLRLLSEVDVMLLCSNLVPLGSTCVAFIADSWSDTAALRYLSCFTENRNGLICSLSNTQDNRAPNLLIGIRPDRVIYHSARCEWNFMESEQESSLKINHPSTKPLMLLEPLATGALGQQCIGDDESAQLLLRSIVEKFGPKFNSNPHNDNEGIGTLGAGVSPKVFAMIGSKLSGSLDKEEKDIAPWIPRMLKKATTAHTQHAPVLIRNGHYQSKMSRNVLQVITNDTETAEQELSGWDSVWTKSMDERKHVWYDGPFGDNEEILLLDSIEGWTGRCRPTIVGKAGVAAAAETGERTLQDILAAAAKGSKISTEDENKESESITSLHEGWVDNIGQGRKDEDNLSLYLRFSEGEGKEENSETDGWKTDGFKDITANGNKMELIGEEMFETELTSSNVDEGEPGKVRPLYDLVFKRDVMEDEQAGMFVKIPRGSSLDVGMFHTSNHDSRQRATIEFWFYLPKLTSAIVLARRSIVPQDESMEKISTSTATETMLWELVALPTGRLEFRTNGGSIINSASVTPNNNEFRVDSDDENMDAGMVSLPRDDGYGGWNHVSLFLSCRGLDPTKCNVSLAMKGAFIASSEVSFQLNRSKKGDAADIEWINESLETTALMFGLGGIEGLRFTEIRVWSCARSFEDVKMMMYEYLDIAKTKKKFKIAIRSRGDAKTGKGSVLIPPRTTEKKLILDRPRASTSGRRSQMDNEMMEEDSSEVIHFANFEETDVNTDKKGGTGDNSVPTNIEKKESNEAYTVLIRTDDDMKNETVRTSSDENRMNALSHFHDVQPSSIISLHESPLISDEIRKSAAAALIRGPPATRHFGGARGGLYYDQATDKIGSICICGNEKTVIFSPEKSQLLPIGASGAIISDEMDGTEYLCCFLAKDKRIVVFDLQKKTVVVELQMTTKLNFWRYLPPSTHGDTLVFMLITPVGGFHWMPLEESPRPRQVWRRGRDLQGKKIVSYEEGGSNGLVGSDCRSTIALLLTSSATSGDPVEAWCVSVGGGFKPLLLSMDVYGAALFQPKSEKMGAFDPMVITVTGDDDNEDVISIDIFKLQMNSDLEYIERGDVISHASFSCLRNISISQPTMAMGVAPLAFCLCCENFVIVIIRGEGLLVAYKVADNVLKLAHEKRLGRYVVDAAIRSQQNDSEGINVVALVCVNNNVKDGRLVTISISD